MQYTNHFPTQLDPFSAAEKGFKWQGKLPISQLKRLALDALGNLDQQMISVECVLSPDPFNHFVWLDAQIQGEVQFECQRCLEPIRLDLNTQVHLAILNDVHFIDYLEHDTDFVVLGENDSSTQSNFEQYAQVDILALIEDELLLMIPFLPKHNDCTHHYQHQENELIEEKQDNPFNILATLKKN